MQIGLSILDFYLGIGLGSGVISNTSLLISPEETTQIRFAHGWSTELEGDPLSPHRWSVAPDAGIEIPKVTPSPLRMGLINVELEAIPYLPFRGPGFQDVIMFLDGALVAALRLYDGEVKTYSGIFAAPMSQNAFSQVRFFLPQSVKPSMIGEGPDERVLGIALKRLKVELT